MLELTITICSWNTRDDLRACLRSLEEARDEAEFEVIVVDNNSNDCSADMVAEEFPWVRLERLFRNLGFAGGHNHAIAMRKAPHAFPLNSDTIVHPGAIRRVLDFANAHEDYGIIGPKLLNPDGSLQLSCRRFPNPVAALFRNTPIGKLFPNNRFTREYLMQDWDHTQPREVDWVSGAAFLVRKEVIDKVGLFDEAYFMFCEDVDWCWRTWQAGFKVVYYPDAVITHAIGRSTDKAPNRMIGRFHRSMFRFYVKNMLPRNFILWRPFAWAGAALAITLRASIFILKNKIDSLKRRLRK
ncbi:MAG TPA: glycosyltransferase family 2 protein [Fimbriimonadaceae bacterium]|nr:glycosyltransferase family 2 protein [Fimbriimonadaceae bacterium]